MAQGGNPISLRDLFDGVNGRAELKAAIKMFVDLKTSYSDFASIVSGSQGASIVSQQAIILEQIREIAAESKNLSISNKATRQSYLENSNAIAQLEAANLKLITAKQKVKQIDDAAAASVNGLKKELNELVATYNKLDPTLDADSQKMQQLSQSIVGVKNQINLLNSALKVHVQEVVAQAGSYEELDLETKKLVRDLKQMSGGLTDTSGKAKALRDQIKTNVAILKQFDETIGDSRRNVGNYKSAFNGLQNAVVQVGREVPNFASDVRIGFLAISNNLPILQEEIRRTKERNAELIAQGKPTVSVFKQITSAILSWQTALIIGITVLVKYGDGMVDATKRLLGFTVLTKEQIAEQKKFKDALVDIEKESAANAAKEIARMDALIKSTQNLSKSQESRTRAALALQKLYPETYGQLTTEAILQKQLGDAYNKTTNAILKQAVAKGAEKRLNLAGERFGETDFNAQTAAEAFDSYVKRFESQDKDIRSKIDRFFTIFFDGNFNKEDIQLADYLKRTGVDLVKLKKLKGDSEAATKIFLESDAELRKTVKDYQKATAEVTDPLVGIDAPDGSIAALQQKIALQKELENLAKVGSEDQIQKTKERIRLEEELAKAMLKGKFSQSSQASAANKAENAAERAARELRRAKLDELKAEEDIKKAQAKQRFDQSDRTLEDEVKLQDELTEITFKALAARQAIYKKFNGLTGEDRETEKANIKELLADQEEAYAKNADEISKIKDKQQRDDERRQREAEELFNLSEAARKEAVDLRLEQINVDSAQEEDALFVAASKKNRNILGREEELQGNIHDIRITALKDQLNILETYAASLDYDKKEQLKAEQAAAKKKKEINKEEADYAIAQEERKKQKRKEVLDAALQLLAQGAAFAAEVASDTADYNIAQAEKTAEYDEKVAGNNADAKAVIESKLRKKIGEEKVRAAKYEKASAIISIGISTAKAAVEALTLGPVAGPIFAALIAAFGAVQIGYVASQPLPAYRGGRGFGRDELAEVNEDGAEPIVHRSGKVRFANQGKRGITYLSKDEKVIPHHKWMAEEYENKSFMDKQMDALLSGTKVYRQKEDAQATNIANALMNSRMDGRTLSDGIADGIKGMVVQENHYNEHGHQVYIRRKNQRILAQNNRMKVGGNG